VVALQPAKVLAQTFVLQQPLRMRLRLNYTMNGTPVTEQAEVNNFPAQLWQ